jgi:hypothetical protein
MFWPRRMPVTPLSVMTASARASQSTRTAHTRQPPLACSAPTCRTDATSSVVQASTDVAIATEFAKMLRQGKVGKKAYSTIISVGHSYGSVQTNALTRTPGLIDHAGGICFSELHARSLPPSQF